jgi:hypothetical protein
LPELPPDLPGRVMGYGPAPSAAGEQRGLDLGRRKLVLTMFGGLALPPVLRLGGLASASPRLCARPAPCPRPSYWPAAPSAAMCMRICPTGVIQPP